MTEARKSTPLSEVRDWLRDHIRGKGAICPACEQPAKVYRRALNHGMTGFLVRAYAVHGQDWFRATEFLNKEHSTKLLSLEYSKLAYWGFLESSMGVREDGGSQGVWRVTRAGVDFIERRTQAPKYVLLYNARLLERSEELVTVDQALSKYFNYEELMTT